MHRNVQLHNLEPVGKHIQTTFDDSQIFGINDFSPDTDKEQKAWFVDFEIVGGNAYLTVDGETDPKADGTLGRPLEPGIPYVLWRGEHRRMKIIAETGATIEFIGQKYYYNELN